jgi:hypothetical protein
MPKFTKETIEMYLDDFFQSLADSDKYQAREVGAIYFALHDDQFRIEIAEQMEDVKKLIEQAEAYIKMRVNTAE